MTPNRGPERPSLDPLPWGEVNGRDSAEIAGQILGLQKAKEARKYECLECSSSDALQAYQGGGLKCYSCGKRWSNVDAVASRLRLSPAEACKHIAQAFGILLPEPARHTKSPRRPPSASEKIRVGLDKEEEPAVLEARSAVYASTLEILGGGRKGGEALSEAGRRYLASRGLDPEASGFYGFRSLEGPKDWQRLGSELSERHSLEELKPAAWWGSRAGEPARFSPPFGGSFPALVIPYWTFGSKLSGLRFRRLDATEKKDRYRDLTGLQPTEPFGTYPVLDGLRSGLTVHIVEGELNAWTLILRNQMAVGLPGAGRPWRKRWPRWFQSAGLVVLWFDNDAAGEAGHQTATDAFADAHGRTWVKEKVRRMPLPTGKDTNALALEGALEAYLEKARL
jgi:hypothetical protein